MSGPVPAAAVAPQPDAATGAAVCAALRREVERLGLSIGNEPDWSLLSFEEKTDPFSREVSLIGTWRGSARYGTVTLFPDGRVFAEYQVLLPHPDKPERYVESVQVWGKPDKLRGEAVIAAYMT
jgi:hypothetical protein